MKAVPLNFEVIGNPVNWAIVILTFIIGGFLLHEIVPTLSDNV